MIDETNVGGSWSKLAEAAQCNLTALPSPTLLEQPRSNLTEVKHVVLSLSPTNIEYVDVLLH